MPNSDWLLFRGLARESKHWGSFTSQMAQMFQAQIHPLDMPGAGDRRSEDTPLSISEIVDQMRAEYLQLKPKPQKLLSISLGSMLAIDWLHRYPNDFTHAVLINTSFRGLSPLHHRLRPSAALQLIKIVATKDPEQREYEVLKMVSNRPERYLDVARNWGDLQKQRPMHLHSFFKQLVAASRFSLPSKKPEAEILLLCSEHDHMVNPNCSERLSRAWQLPLRIHESAGHDLPLDDPQWTLSQIDAWLKR